MTRLQLSASPPKEDMLLYFDEKQLEVLKRILQHYEFSIGPGVGRALRSFDEESMQLAEEWECCEDTLEKIDGLL